MLERERKRKRENPLNINSRVFVKCTSLDFLFSFLENYFTPFCFPIFCHFLFNLFQKKVTRFRVNSQSSVLLENIGQLDSIIVYFDQLLGAARTQKLVEIPFFSSFQSFLLKSTKKRQFRGTP